MKTLNLLLFVALLLTINVSCLAQSNKNEDNTSVSKSKDVEVFYFHYTRRCATCNAVEKVSKEAVSEFYGDRVSFVDFNLDETDGETKARELDVSGQTLLIVAGKSRINITNEGFMNARTNPDKLKQIIKEIIDPLL